MQNKGAKVVTDNARTWTLSTPNTLVSVLDKTLTKRPEVVEAYLNGLLCAADIINSDPAKAVALLTKGTYYRVPTDVLLQAFKSAPAPISFVPDVAAVQSVVADLTKLGYIKGKTTANDIFKLDIIKRLESARK